MSTKKTKMGKDIDMSALMSQSGDTLAVGNLSMNARGDILDTKGNVVKTAKEQADEYYKENPKAVKHVSIKDTVPEDAAKAKEAVEPKKTTQRRTSRVKKDDNEPTAEAPDTLAE